MTTSMPTGVKMQSSNIPVARFLPLGPNHLPDTVVDAFTVNGKANEMKNIARVYS
jgi:hypothetical protein